MKHIKIFLTLCLVVLTSISCDLNPTPESATTADTFFSTDGEILSGIINIYDGIQGLNPLESDGGFNNSQLGIQIEYQMAEILSDNARTKSGSAQGFDFEIFNVNSQTAAVLTYYRSFYNVIFRANLVLENIENASAGNANVFEAEARFLRAYAYFNLVRFYGDLPLIDRVISPDETELAFTRVDQSLIYDLIVSDLEFAVNSDLDNSFRTRASKAAAQTFLAKVYMTLGTNYLAAQQLLEQVIGSQDYSLESNFVDIFYNEANSETVWAIGYDNTSVDDSNGFSAEFLDAVGRGTGSNYATDDFLVLLNAIGGDRTQFTVRQDPGNLGQFQTVKYLPSGDDDLGIPSTSSNPRIAGNDFIVTRYADVLLLHVEAIMAGGSETSVPAAITSFQLVRERAGITDPVTTITKQDLMDERRVELAFENHRFLDLKRFGEAQAVLSAFSNAESLQFQATDLLLPIPSAEISISNGLLTQNPGY